MKVTDIRRPVWRYGYRLVPWGLGHMCVLDGVSQLLDGLERGSERPCLGGSGEDHEKSGGRSTRGYGHDHKEST